MRAVPRVYLPQVTESCREGFQLRQTHCCLEIGKLEVESKRDVLVGSSRASRWPPLILQLAQPLVHRCASRDDRATLPGGNRLVGREGKAASITECSEWTLARQRAQRFGGVLDNGQPVRAGKS